MFIKKINALIRFKTPSPEIKTQKLYNTYNLPPVAEIIDEKLNPRNCIIHK